MKGKPEIRLPFENTQSQLKTKKQYTVFTNNFDTIIVCKLGYKSGAGKASHLPQRD